MGRSIIVDYEFNLHSYLNKEELKKQGLVPVEMYPYADDIQVGYVHVDAEFGAADTKRKATMAELLRDFEGMKNAK